MENLPSIFVQREKYPFLPDDVFMPIEAPIVPKEISGRYGVNKRGEIIYFNTRKIRKPYVDYQGYLIISFELRENNKVISLKYRVHRLVALIFLENLNKEIYNVVNHINCIRTDNKLSNLEWTTVKENSSHEKRSKIRKEVLYQYIGRDDNGNIVECFVSREVPEIYDLRKIQKSIYKNKKNKTTDKCYNLYWSCEKPKRDIYGFSGNLDDYEWYEHWKYPGIYVCKEGFIKNSNQLLYGLNPTPGSYVMVKINRKNLLAHRVIMEYILKRDLRKNEIVDHINTIRIDNSFCNLRLTDSLGNSRNENTLRSLSNTIILSDLYGDFILKGITRDIYNFVYGANTYNSANDSSTILKTTIIRKNYVSFKLNDSNTLYKKLSKVYYLVNEDKTEILGAFLSYKDICDFLNILYRRTSKKLNEKIYKIFKYIILIGNDAISILKSTGHLTALNPENNQPLDM